MYIDNYLKPQVTPVLHYTDQTIGVILKTNEELEKDNLLGVYIPKLMFGLPVKNGVYEKTVSIDTGKILNSKNKKVGSTSFKVKNYVVLPVSMNPNINTPKYNPGENVIVDFADKDIKSAYVLPYSFGDTNRRKTDVITVFVNNFKEEQEPLGLHNIYALQLDTANQIASLFTSDNNGEKGVYTFALNGKDGTILISDSGKRKIRINTDDDSISLLNEAQSEFTMIDKVINMKADILNVKMESEINFETSKITRKADIIETEASEDTEKIDKLTLEGNDYTLKYNKQILEGSSHENTTSKFKVDSPISGFTQVLTSNQFSISPNAGIQPPVSAATINPGGIAMFGNPSTSALPLAVAPPTINALMAIAATVDGIGAAHCVPPVLVANISALAANITSTRAMG
jgi:hypothetical protein